MATKTVAALVLLIVTELGRGALGDSPIRDLLIPLNGVQEAQVADVGATGTLHLKIFQTGNHFKLDFKFDCLNLTQPLPPTAQHIHQGFVDQSGGVVLAWPGQQGQWQQQGQNHWTLQGKIDNTDALTNAQGQTYTQVIQNVLQTPAGFYINVHTQKFPNGAIRGQVDGGIQRYTFSTINDNKDPTFNQLLGINNAGIIAGYFGSGASGHPNKGYTVNPPYAQGQFVDENFPNSTQTQVTGINNNAQTCGFWVDQNGNSFGFILNSNKFTKYQHPNTTGTVNQLLGVNDKLAAAGFFTDGQGNNHGYTLDANKGTFQDVVPPTAVSTTATGINDNGDVSGFFTNADGAALGFLLKGGSFTTFTFPGSNNTQALGVNSKDEVVGVYVDGTGKMHGFIVRDLVDGQTPWFETVDDPNGVGTTTVNGLNDNGDLVGFFVDGIGNTNGMLAKRFFG